MRKQLLVSPDEKAALITAGFVTDRLSNLEIYRAVFDHLMELQKREQDRAHPAVHHRRAARGRLPARARLGDRRSRWWARCSAIFVLLWAYFRRWHGVLIPMVAAGVTVIWGTGFTGWAGIAFDPLVIVIPMLITARAVSHTVQMAERFFEDYERLYPAVRRRAAREARGRGGRDGRADRARHARHPDRRRGPARDPRDHDPADARPRRVRRVLGRGDRRHGRDPAPGADLLAAAAARTTTTTRPS